LFLLHFPISLSRRRNLRRQPTNPVDTFWKYWIKKVFYKDFFKLVLLGDMKHLYDFKYVKSVREPLQYEFFEKVFCVL
jgi:hypothetical protein